MHILRSLFIIFIATFLSISVCAHSKAQSAQANKKKPYTASNPAFVSATQVEYDAAEDFIQAKGNVIVVMDNYTLTADSILYDIEKDLLWAEGLVKIKDQKQQMILGQSVIFKDKFKTGIIENFIFKFKDNSLLASRLAKRVDQDHSELYKSSFTPCQTYYCGHPIWQISAKHAAVDFDKQKMTYRNVWFEVYGVPILFTPYFSHPTPKANAQSGVLLPSIRKNSLGIPLYYRVKPNLDITLTPRIARKYTLFEMEFRHKLNNGSYSARGSFSHAPYKNKKVNSGYISSNGNFYKDDYQYGFKLNRTSDKAYLKNYHGRNDAYLISNIYLHKVRQSDYTSVEGLNFQGLGIQDSNATDPLIAPKIKTKNILYLNDSQQTYLSLVNDALVYTEQHGNKLTRAAIEISLMHNMQTPNGHLISLSGRSREDIYLVNQTSQKNKHHPKTLSRNIPEFSAKWRYPLYRPLGNLYIMSIEPIVSVTLGPKFKASYNKFGYIDSPKYEIDETNLFNPNRYSGIDYHEYGNRLNYGLNLTTLFNGFNISNFIGQSIYKYNSKTNDNGEIVNKFAINFSDRFEIFWRFRKTKHFKSIRDEVGSVIRYDKLTLTTGLVNLHKLDRYFFVENIDKSKNTLKQANYNVEYQLTPSWLIGHEAIIDLSSKKMHSLYRSIKVTYSKDCVSITARFYDDYTQDPARGIKKSHGKTVSIGLKVLNM